MSVHLLEAPLMRAQDQYLRLVEGMANVLLQEGAYGDADEAWRTLRAFGYSARDIAVVIDDVRQAAAQDAVAKVMSQS
jgi:Holliday junction resolvasome RuvABC DNA-binding subunit